MAVVVDVRDDEVLAYLDRLAEHIEDMTPAMDAIGQRLEERISMRFETETSPSGAAWAPWAKRTRAGYPKDGHGRILDRYGDMLRSLSHQASPDGVTVGFGQPYSAYHEFGTRYMPRRGMLFSDPDSGTLGREDALDILDVVRGFLDQP